MESAGNQRWHRGGEKEAKSVSIAPVEAEANGQTSLTSVNQPLAAGSNPTVKPHQVAEDGSLPTQSKKQEGRCEAGAHQQDSNCRRVRDFCPAAALPGVKGLKNTKHCWTETHTCRFFHLFLFLPWLRKQSGSSYDGRVGGLNPAASRSISVFLGNPELIPVGWKHVVPQLSE